MLTFATQNCISGLHFLLVTVAKPSSTNTSLMIDQLFSGKIRAQLLTRLLLNPATKVYLRGLERDFGVSSNTVRIELKKLSEMNLICENSENTNRKQYTINKEHPLFHSLRDIVLKDVGLDRVLEQVIGKLGDIQCAYLTGDMAEGKNSNFVDIVLVGNIDKAYLYELVDKTERLIGKKIRVGIFSPTEFRKDSLADVGAVVSLMSS